MTSDVMVLRPIEDMWTTGFFRFRTSELMHLRTPEFLQVLSEYCHTHNLSITGEIIYVAISLMLIFILTGLHFNKSRYLVS